jgi:hypothetical protein
LSGPGAKISMIDTLYGPTFRKLPDHRSLPQEESVNTNYIIFGRLS